MILGEDNYRHWLIQERARLAEYWEFAKNEAGSSDKSKRRSSRFYGKLQKNMNGFFRREVTNMTTGKEILDYLESFFKQRNQHTKELLQRQIHGFEWQGSGVEDLMKNYDRFKDLIYRYNGADGEMDEATAARCFIRNCRVDEFLGTISFMQGTTKGLTLDGAYLSLQMIREEHRQSSNGRSDGQRNGGGPTAFVTCWTCGEEGHVQGKCPRKKAECNVTCHNCGKQGHMKAQCRKGKKGEKANNNGRKAMAFTTQIKHRFSIPEALSGQVKFDDWIVDSGASWNFVNSMKGVEEFIASQDEVGTADKDQSIAAIGTGKVKLNELLTLEVMVVPSLKYNMLSVARAEENGFQVLFNNGKVKFIYDDFNYLEGTRRDGLYFVDAKYCKASTREAMEISPANRDRAYSRAKKGPKVAKSRISHDIVYVTPESIGGAKFCSTHILDDSRWAEVRILQRKSDVGKQLIQVVAKLERQFKISVDVIRADRARENMTGKLSEWCAQTGRIQEFANVQESRDNPKVERLHRTLLRSVREDLVQSGMDEAWWAEAMLYSTFKYNRTVHSATKLSPFEALTGLKPIQSFIPFGCLAIYRDVGTRNKVSPRGKRAVFLNHSLVNDKGYRLLDLESGEVIESRNVIFDHATFPMRENNDQASSSDEDSDGSESDSSESEDDDEDDDDDDDSDDDDNDNDSEHSDYESSTEFSGDTGAIETPILGKRCDLDSRNIVEGRTRSSAMTLFEKVRRQVFLCNLVNEDLETADATKIIEARAMITEVMMQPTSELVKGKDSKMWDQAIHEEFEALRKLDVFESVKQLPSMRVLPSRLVNAKKFLANGQLEKFKSRLTAGGHREIAGVDYQLDKVYAPVMGLTPLRLLMAIGISKKYVMKLGDIKNAYLHAPLNEPVFIRYPEGYEEYEKGHVMKLKKALYGLHESGRTWFDFCSSILLEIGFTQSKADPTIFQDIKEEVIIGLYVDDTLLLAPNDQIMKEVVERLTRKLPLKFYNLDRGILGIECRLTEDGRWKLSQEGYAHKVLQEMDVKGKPVHTPMVYGEILTSEGERTKVKDFAYRKAVGSLLWMARACRPDIAYAVSQVSRFLENPTDKHQEAVIRILKYIAGTTDYGIIMTPVSGRGLEIFVDADLANCVDTRKSVTGFVCFYDNMPISWYSKNQSITAQSTTEAEYVAAADAVKDALYIRNIIQELGFGENKINVYEDNIGTIELIKAKKVSQRTKHLDIRYHLLRDCYQEGFLNVKYCPTERQLADILTKAVPVKQFRKFVSRLLCASGDDDFGDFPVGKTLSQQAAVAG